MEKYDCTLNNIPAFKGTWDTKEVYLDLHEGRLGVFRKITPLLSSWHTTARITLWNDNKLKVDNLWIQLQTYNKDSGIIDFRQLEVLYLKCKLLMKIKKKDWKVKE